MTVKERLDVALVSRGLAETREKAKAIIMAGIVYVNNQKSDKAGATVKADDIIEVRGETLKYVSRGGLKLEKAMKEFPITLDGKITMDILKEYGDDLGKAEFLLFYTGYGELFYSPEYLADYPVIDEGVLDFIIRGDYKGIGFDTISLDPMAKLTMHRRLFSEKEMINIENLTNLGEAAGGLFDFVCLPLSVKDSDGAPCRAIAMVEN